MLEYLILGGGVFGLATALELAQQGHDVTVIDRAEGLPPSPDAASSDLNKIIRSDYTSEIYTKLAVEAIEEWQTGPLHPCFHQSGLIALAKEATGKATFAPLIQLQLEHNPNFKQDRLVTPEAIINRIKAPSAPPNFVDCEASFNNTSGWGEASKAMDLQAKLCSQAGVKFISGRIVHLTYSDDKCTGVVLENGQVLEAHQVVLATGSWTPSLCPDLADRLTATGQVIAAVQLTNEQMAQYQSMPVIISPDTGFYILPPNKDQIVKFAIHGVGYLNPQPSMADQNVSVSTPRTKHFEGDETDNIPRQAVLELRTYLQHILPELAKQDFIMTRTCWYCDTKDSHFIISRHPHYRNLFIATGGSGHAFKFLPIIGKYVVAGLKDELPSDLRDVWAYDKDLSVVSDFRAATQGKELLRDLASADDLRAP